VAACKLAGKVAGCNCDYASVERLIHQDLQPVLSKLVKLPFFRYFKVDLYCDCKIFPDAESMCFNEDCCVKPCDDVEVPQPWRQGEAKCSSGSEPAPSGVDRSVDAGVRERLTSIGGWSGLHNPWVPEDDEGVDYVYVNLQINPEKYTGYKGEDARRIWASIYSQSVLAEVQQAGSGSSTPQEEKQVLYRLVSGMHSSITTSIVNNFYNQTSGTWGPNIPFFKARFTGPAAKPYIENLYFTFLFTLRAAMKVSPLLQAMDFNTGYPEEDTTTQQLVRQLVEHPALLASCPAPFDEGMLWGSESGDEELEQQLQVAFHNITRIMDCVGCEKCKMWGKLQILGIATSLKILFSERHLQKQEQPHAKLQLQRNEVIALVNLLAKLADSIETVRSLSIVIEQADSQAAAQQQQQEPRV